MWSSTCFGRHAAHHQEPKTALAASDLHNTVEGCWTCCCWMLSGRVSLPDSVQQPHVQQPSTALCKPEAASTVFGLLMMGGVSPETCWASYKYGIINVDTLVHLVGFFCMTFTMMHGSTNIKVACVSVCALLDDWCLHCMLRRTFWLWCEDPRCDRILPSQHRLVHCGFACRAAILGMADLWRDFWIRETGTGQQVTQLHDRYMMMMMMT